MGRIFVTIENCPNCGGTHYGSVTCPYIEKPCVVCGEGTILACSDCAIDGRGSVHVCKKAACRLEHDAKAHPPKPEPGVREKVIQLLWEKQFEGSPWQRKFHLIRPDSLEADYGTFADKIIATVRADIENCFTLTDRRQAPMRTGGIIGDPQEPPDVL
jgi:hypothetical protein